jgi:hypothetical protein
MKTKILIFLMLFMYLGKGYGIDTLFLVFDAKAKNQGLTLENSFCQHPDPHHSKICIVSNYYKAKGIVSGNTDDCLYYEFVFYNYTVVDSAWHKTFMDTIIMNYKELLKRPDGSISPLFNEDFVSRERDPIILDSQFISIKRKDVFFLSNLTSKEILADLNMKMKASMNTIYLVDITPGLRKRMYGYKVSWYNSANE